MPRTYKICSPLIPGLGSHEASPTRSSDQVATNERVDNVRITPLAGSGPFGMAMPRAAVERMKLWENGRRLRVVFLDGVVEVKNKVTAIAKEWEAIANLTLDFISSGAAEIRISFAEQGFSWSTVGTDALTVASSRATMNYGWLEPNTSLREYQRVVRHEFGHALGMIHEHQNPAALGQIPWDKEKVYAYYAQQKWSRADVDFNIFGVYAEDSTNHTAFDPTSIMEYAIPDSLTVGSFSIGWNTTFSATDIEFMRRQYPTGSPGMVELSIGGPVTSADLSAGGEVDTYHFDVATAATFIMSTEGPSDTVLTLHGPNDPGAVLAWDDDRGKGRNARIVRKLFPGSYWLSVRHKNPAATGIYTIGVKKQR
ncbi:MAG: M12 family metallopeptidase [Acidobacteriota bacterium]|nr:M12 family metallopeptidase [Acidobacteriota bacterium]